MKNCTIAWGVAVIGLAGIAAGQGSGGPTRITPPSQPGAAVPETKKDAAAGAIVMDPSVQEAPFLAGHTQLTFRKDFIKAGEAYFSPDGKWIIFQAVAAPTDGSPANPNAPYAMYVAKLKWDEPGQRILALDTPIQISPPGSANTCGWFHPKDPGRVIFGSTLVPPSNQQKPGFQVGTNRYIWSFPSEMEVVTCEVGPVFLDHYSNQARQEEKSSGQRMIDPPHLPDQELHPVFRREGYDAECSYTKDGRFILYAHVDESKNPAKPDADLWVYDTESGGQRPLITADGYDGGPFWSPDGKRICYRSDRKGDDLLQVFVAEVKWENGAPVGIVKETPITANEHVNWCPYWHPSGEFLVYATSEIGHRNYEVFAIESSRAGDAPARKRRVTFAEGADVLPAFSPDGKWMMWTSQRGPKADGEERPSSQLWIARWNARDASEMFATP